MHAGRFVLLVRVVLLQPYTCVQALLRVVRVHGAAQSPRYPFSVALLHHNTTTGLVQAIYSTTTSTYDHYVNYC